MKRVLHITNIPTPYRIPQLNEMDRQLREAGWKLKVVFGGAGYERRKWKLDLSDCHFDYEMLSSRVPLFGSAKRVLFLYNGLLRTLRDFEPDVVSIAGFSIATIKVMLWSLVRRVPYLIFSGSIRYAGKLDSAWRLGQRRLLARRAAAGVAYGSQAREYLISLGMRAEEVFVAINTVDVAFFRDETERLRQAGRPADGVRTLLFLGYLEKRKRVDQLLQAVKQLHTLRDDFRLVIVGDGPEKAALQTMAAELEIESLVRFEGYRQRNELPKYFAAADAFLFSTDYDIWGLVLNEAMAAKVPCLASVKAGATRDLIRAGETGFAVDFSRTDEVVERIGWILDHPGEAAAIGCRASHFINENASVARSAAGFVQAVLHARASVHSGEKG